MVCERKQSKFKVVEQDHNKNIYNNRIHKLASHLMIKFSSPKKIQKFLHMSA
jgi:hypothetical protein